jgi:hypothetical protein
VGEADEASQQRARALRETLIWLGFALLLGAAIATVALPELADEPDDGATAEDQPADAGTP